jgi:hypothetical protein
VTPRSPQGRTAASASTGAGRTPETPVVRAESGCGPGDPGTEPGEVELNQHVEGPVEEIPRDAGMATAEYAMATLAACGFAALLIAILRSDEVRGMLLGIVRQGLSLG